MNASVVRQALADVSGFLTLVSLGLYMVVNATFWVRLRRGQRELRTPGRAPRVSILKPLAGADDEFEDNLESFMQLDYPEYELLLGVASPDDVAAPIATRVMGRHPRTDAQVIVTNPNAALNPKVAQLIGLLAQATGDIVVISDSNVRVRPDYLWSCSQNLEDPAVGLVTHLLSGTGERTLGAALENLQLGAVIAPGVVAADACLPRPITIGKSMSMRRRDLARLGNFGSVGGLMAEDYALGRLFAEAGFGVRTSLHTVENRNVNCGVGRMLERHTRWAKLRRSMTPVAFAFEPILSPVAFASLAFLTRPSALAGAGLALVGLIQCVVAACSLRLLRGGWRSWHMALLEVPRAYAALACWLRACVSRRVMWRNHAFVLHSGTLLVPDARRSKGLGQRLRPQVNDAEGRAWPPATPDLSHQLCQVDASAPLWFSGYSCIADPPESATLRSSNRNRHVAAARRAAGVEVASVALHEDNRSGA